MMVPFLGEGGSDGTLFFGGRAVVMVRWTNHGGMVHILLGVNFPGGTNKTPSAQPSPREFPSRE